MGLDIIIALANDRKNAYAELRYALRSIDKHLTGHRDIYLIGEKPAWVKGIIHVPQRDLTGRKQLSIYNKFLTAAKSENVSENFIRWDDDVYLLQPMDTTEIKHWHGGTLKEWSVKNINMMYRNVIKNTLKLFPDGYYYDIHAPRVFNKAKYQELVKYPWMVKELLTKSTYFNSVETEPIYMADPKQQQGLFLSTDGLKPEQAKMLRSLFPNPSRYETDNQTYSQAASSVGAAER